MYLLNFGCNHYCYIHTLIQNYNQDRIRSLFRQTARKLHYSATKVINDLLGIGETKNHWRVMRGRSALPKSLPSQLSLSICNIILLSSDSYILNQDNSSFPFFPVRLRFQGIFFYLSCFPWEISWDNNFLFPASIINETLETLCTQGLDRVDRLKSDAGQ